jgi:hypothetical protein
MTSYLYCRVVETSKGKALVPDDRQSEAMLGVVKIGRRVMVKTKTARNPKQHRLLWALAAKIADNCERFQDAEHVVHELKIQTGHVERRQINVPGLGMVFQEWPKSIAYESMSQEDFANWFERVLAYVSKSIWPGISSDEIRKELAEMLGDDWFPGDPATRSKEDAAVS